jgi:hypothetical protein
MKIPSLKVLFENAKETLLRFPFVILSSVIGTGFIIYLLDLPFDRQDAFRYLYNVVMVCSLGIPFLLSLVFICERIKTTKVVSFLVQLFGMILLLAYYYSLPKDIGYTDITRYILFIIGMHLLVSFSPFAGKIFSLERRGFWQFNRNLFIGILITGVYSGVLYLGLSIAILSFDKLFDVNIDSKIYGQLFFFILGVFNTWFFLSGLSGNLDELDKIDYYPKGLKIFTQYVLLPLVIIYLLILYLYMGKIIIQWHLPMGWVSYLVLGFSITGIFSLLLIEPLRELEGNNWIKIFSKWFYLILFPLIVLLFVAIIRRTGEYGITERRYFVFVLALWLTVIAFYFSINKIKNIKIIPYSLCVVAFLTSFGPWGAFNLSEKSQFSRLEEILTKNKLLIDGKIVKGINPLSEEERQEVSSAIKFFSERKSLEKIQPWFDINLDTIKNETTDNVCKTKEAKITDLMGIEYTLFKVSQNNRYFYWNIKDYYYLNIKDFEYKVNFRFNNSEKEKGIKEFTLDSNIFVIDFNEDSLEIIIKNNNLQIGVLKIDKLMENLRKLKTDPLLKDMSIEEENDKVKCRVIFRNINGERENETNKINSFSSEVFLKFK